ncbi:MAG: peptidoglycan-binding domain-containing protein [Coleofasciculus sp. B1-GNL1-01]|uniref:peptidoglycan-binding domain-containing protein n=1 Tax=Coleofasciculus sp. B1-GNL1-01 TaxID=3068484 RepID=UPI0032FEF1D9
MSTRIFPSSFVSVGVVSVMSLASVGLASAPINAQVPEAATDLEEYDTTAPTLGYGNTGETVADVQSFLKEQGYYNGAIDGVYGERTREAVRTFQEDRGLFGDGIIGNQTWDAMTDLEAGTEDDFIDRESDLEAGTEDDFGIE